MQDIAIRAEIPAPRSEVWKLLSDHRSMVDWAGAKEVVLRQEGHPPPNGLGAIRVVRGAGLAIEEEVLEFEPPRRLGYRINAGLPLPVRDYRASVTLEPKGPGTTLVWQASFEPRIPGTGRLLGAIVRRLLQRLAAGLAAAAVQASARSANPRAGVV